MTSSPIQRGCDNHQDGNKTTSDFSIEHILNHAGKKNNRLNCEPFRSFPEGSECPEMLPLVQFPWLQCTRYCPPKIPRSQKKDGPQKRQLGRHPRIPFTSHQSSVLEERFKQSPYLSSEEVTKLSAKLQLPGVRVKIWFQNRRARERRERNLSEDMLLKSPTKTSKPTPASTGCLTIKTEENNTTDTAIPNNLFIATSLINSPTSATFSLESHTPNPIIEESSRLPYLSTFLPNSTFLNR